MLKPGEFIMTHKDVVRLDIITKVSEKRLLQKEAASLLNLTERQIRRILTNFKMQGPSGIIHASRGSRSNRRRDDKLTKKIVKLYKKKYKGFGPTLAAEKMKELNEHVISNESLRMLLIEENLWKPRRNRKRHLKHRDRKDYFGEMVQLDGSHHDWLEGRGPKMVLMGYIDDATGNTYGRFYDYEGTQPAMDSFRRYIKKYGIPRCIYFDRHSTYKNNNAKVTIEDELKGKEPLSQFSRALEEIGVRFIHANSPQAKGRIERSFNTHQDRLIKEMRLANIKTMEDANKFLDSYYWKKHNKKFTVTPKGSTDLHLQSYSKSTIDRSLSKMTPHPIKNDRTITHHRKWYQILSPISAKKKVIVEERYDGKMFITYNNKPLKFKEIEKPVKQKNSSKKRSTTKDVMQKNYFNTSNWSHQDCDRYKKEWEENYVTRLVGNF